MTEHPEAHDYALTKVRVRLERFKGSQDPAAVVDPVALAEVAELLDKRPDADADSALAAGLLHWFRYVAMDPGAGQSDLAAALRLLQLAYDTRPDAIPDQVREYFDLVKTGRLPAQQMLAVFAVLTLGSALRTGSSTDLDKSVELLRHALNTVPKDHPSRADFLSALGVGLGARFRRSQAQADLDEAIAVSSQAVDVTPAGHPDRASWLSNLGAALRIRFERSGMLADLDEAIATSLQAVAAVPDNHPDRAICLANLSAVMRIRFEQTGAPAELDEAIAISRQAVDAAPDDHPNRAAMLSDLGTALRIRFKQHGTPTDLDEAIAISRQAVDAAPDDHSGRAGYLSNLALALRERFARSAALPDMNEVITAIRQVVDAIPDDYPYRASHLTDLSLILQTRFKRYGTAADLDEAITASRHAVNAAPEDHPDRARRLSSLSTALRARFEQSGVPADLNEAITTSRQALDVTPDGHPDRPVWLSNLSIALQPRFRQFGALADLDEAIATSRQAVDAIPDDNPDRAGPLSNLGLALLARFERSGALADLDEAITTIRQAVDTAPEERPNRAGHLSSLSIALRKRFRRSGALADLDEATTASRQAVEATPEGHPDRAIWLSNHGAALRARFGQSGVPTDLNEAIIANRQAVDASPDDHPDRAGRLCNLGLALRTRFERFGAPVDLNEAIIAYREAEAVDMAPPSVQALAARNWGLLAAFAGQWHEALAGFEAAVGLIGQVAPRSLVRDDQEHALESLANVASDAAACCIRAGKADRAVELLEQGRGILLGQALDTRTDLTSLAERHPQLAERFTKLRDALDRASDTSSRPGMLPGQADPAQHLRAAALRLEADRQRVAAEEFGQLITQIRDQPDFHGFLRPPSVRDLLPATANGPVAIINVSWFGSHALILTPGGILDPIQLDMVTPRRVADQVTGLITALGNPRAPVEEQARLADTLGWLWDTIASPVLDRLGFTGPPPDGQPWPRIWWCLPGLLSFLPLHAAGHHHSRSEITPQTVMDRVVSSYTPTIRSLLYAHNRPSPAGNIQVLAVALPHTPGAPDLPAAQAEANMLRQRLGAQVTTLTGSQATPDAVLATLPTAQWAHFACHGTADPSNPSASCLHLADRHKLTVTDIARLRLHDADLAYLSACSTAQPTAQLADEAIHLASAFQLAGYRHVIGTLWPVTDLIGARIASDLYNSLAEAQALTNPAEALHTAILRLRNRQPHQPTCWASHIHSGA